MSEPQLSKQMELMQQNAAYAFREVPTFENLWELIIQYQSHPFRTVKGLTFTYEIHGGEMRVSRKEKTITKSSVKIAFQRAKASEGITGPKKLGVFGASYLYPVFMELGVIRMISDKEMDR
ncbi:MAG: hypothetical protein LUD07_03835 [Clostridiales bacterium]|nr:hypothetical protein [Clostridiales bacterium]